MVALTRSHWTLAGVFVAWKTTLALIALASPGPGYDTSTTLLGWSSEQPPYLSKFVRWDAIYFTQIAQHGHIHEQQWAWGIGYPALLSASARCMCPRSLPVYANHRQLSLQPAILHCLSSLSVA
jgi:GPI mannosyltransferase 2